MSTAIIIGVIIALCIIALKSYLKKLAHGCCGAGRDDENRSKSAPDLSEYRYRYIVKISGMFCKNCAVRIENALKRQGSFARADHKNGTAEIYSKAVISEFTVRRTIVGLGYSVEEITEI